MIRVKVKSISPEVLGTDKKTGLVFHDKKWIEYRRKWDQYPQAGIVDKVPLQIDLFAVDVCNLKCPMCPRQAYIPGKGYMDLNLVKKILDQACTHGLCAFNLTGLGEPTLYPQLFEVIRYAKEKGVIDVNMHTNGTLLGHDFNRKLIESGLDRLIISLDSADKERYEKIRIGARFEKVMQAVEDLIRQRNQNPKSRLHIKANFIEMDEDDPSEKNKFIAYWAGKLNRIAILRYLDCKTGEERLYHRENYKQDDNFCCAELWRRLTILSDGTATLCPRDMKKGYVIGDVLTQTVPDIWTGEIMQKVRKLHRQGGFKKMHLCADCPDSFDSKRDTQ
ncbi:MAG: radical SAM/SPASM domain-containing protein [Candidatus Omnitrophota bacterium]|jgi:radical SAM protein with 4Fe4S-binding SPASM domain